MTEKTTPPPTRTEDLWVLRLLETVMRRALRAEEQVENLAKRLKATHESPVWPVWLLVRPSEYEDAKKLFPGLRVIQPGAPLHGERIHVLFRSYEILMGLGEERTWLEWESTVLMPRVAARATIAMLSINDARIIA